MRENEREDERDNEREREREREQEFNHHIALRFALSLDSTVSIVAWEESDNPPYTC